MIQKIDNQQGYNLTNNQKQVLLMEILNKYHIDCFNYKLWSSETILKWSKLKAELKSRNIEVTPRMFTNILNGVSSI